MAKVVLAALLGTESAYAQFFAVRKRVAFGTALVFFLVLDKP